MAKIKGFELKNVKTFRGHEGEELQQANVYYKGKKIGYYSQDSWGGCDIFNIDYDISTELKEEIDNITNNYVGNIIFKKLDDLWRKEQNVSFKYDHIGYEYLFEDLLQLIYHEQLYKEYSKRYGENKIFIVYLNSFTLGVRNQNNLKNEEKKLTYFEYNGLEDFIIE